MTSKAFSNLETSRLFLRNVKIKDTDFIYDLFSNEVVCQYLYDEALYTRKEDAIEFIEWNQNPEEKGYNRWVLIEKEDGQTKIGTCGYDSWDQVNHIAEIGYDLLPTKWGKGYMTEALTCAIENGFEKMGLNRINAFVALGNIDSVKLLEKLGFVMEGIYREKHLFEGKYYDHYSFSLLKRDWQSK